MIEIPLKPIPNDKWQEEYKLVMQDPYVSRKYNRRRRIKDKVDYINQYLPEVKKQGATVLDLGPGPGEFMEVCEHYGKTCYGIDADLDDCEMGFEYVKLSKLMAQRQGLNIQYVGLLNMIENGGLPFEDESISFINSQGSIEQIFAKYMVGPSHKKHKNCNLLSWEIDAELIDIFSAFFAELNRVLEPEGRILIYGNGAKNVNEYNQLLRQCIDDIDGLEIVIDVNSRLTKIRKDKP